MMANPPPSRKHCPLSFVDASIFPLLLRCKLEPAAGFETATELADPVAAFDQPRTGEPDTKLALEYQQRVALRVAKPMIAPAPAAVEPEGVEQQLASRALVPNDSALECPLSPWQLLAALEPHCWRPQAQSEEIATV